MSEDSEREAIRVGNAAKAELELCGLAFKNLQAEIIGELIVTNLDQADKRERLCFALKTLATVETVLRDAVQNRDNAMAYRNALAESGLTRA